MPHATHTSSTTHMHMHACMPALFSKTHRTVSTRAKRKLVMRLHTFMRSHFLHPIYAT